MQKAMAWSRACCRMSPRAAAYCCTRRSTAADSDGSVAGMAAAKAFSSLSARPSSKFTASSALSGDTDCSVSRILQTHIHSHGCRSMHGCCLGIGREAYSPVLCSVPLKHQWHVHFPPQYLGTSQSDSGSKHSPEPPRPQEHGIEQLSLLPGDRVPRQSDVGCNASGACF